MLLTEIPHKAEAGEAVADAARETAVRDRAAFKAAVKMRGKDVAEAAGEVMAAAMVVEVMAVEVAAAAAVAGEGETAISAPYFGLRMPQQP